MRIAALMPEMAINSIYRSLIPMQALAHRGHTIHIEERNEVRNPEMLLECDLVQFMRFYHPEMVRMARRLRDAGVAVVYDNDDDSAALAAGSGRRDAGLLGKRVQAGIASMVRTAHAVTTPSEVLAEMYRGMDGGPVHVLENYLPPTFARPERVMPHNGVTIGWLAALEHQGDYEQLRLREVFERLLARHQHLEIISVGLGLGLNSKRYRHMPITLYGELPELLVHFDIGLAPLSDIRFNRARSTVKVKEYAALGVPWLASPIGPYVGLGEEQGGRLVDDDSWYREIERLVLEADDRRRLARRARVWAQEQTIEHHVEEWEQVYADAIERARAAHAVR